MHFESALLHIGSLMGAEGALMLKTARKKLVFELLEPNFAIFGNPQIFENFHFFKLTEIISKNRIFENPKKSGILQGRPKIAFRGVSFERTKCAFLLMRHIFDSVLAALSEMCRMSTIAYFGAAV